MRKLNNIYKFFLQGNLKIFLSLLVLSLLAANTDAQTRERKWNLGLLGGFNVYAGNLGNSMTDFTFDVLRQNIIGGVTVSRYINKSFDVSTMGTIGSWGYYLNHNTVFKGNMLHLQYQH